MQSLELRIIFFLEDSLKYYYKEISRNVVYAAKSKIKEHS